MQQLLQALNDESAMIRDMLDKIEAIENPDTKEHLKHALEERKAQTDRLIQLKQIVLDNEARECALCELLDRPEHSELKKLQIKSLEQFTFLSQLSKEEFFKSLSTQQKELVCCSCCN